MDAAKQEEIKLLLEKINLLIRIFDKEGIDKISKLEKELLKEQANNLLHAIEELEVHAIPVEAAVPPPPAPKQVAPDPPKQIEQVEAPAPKVEEVPAKEVEEVAAQAPSTPKSTEHLSLNERLALMKEKGETSISNGSKYRNMKEIIDLNKSFIFKKQLFDNNNETYNSFISELNQTDSEESAQVVIDKYADKLGWDTEEKVYELICRAAEKRFLPIL